MSESATLAGDSPSAIIAEDEPLLAEELADLLRRLWPQLRIVECATDGVAALHAIETHAPDLAFLDIHMPLLTGLDVARHVAGRCHVALITAYDEHAVAAFEAGAIDYILKPFDAARLLKTVQRLKLRLPHAPARLDHLASDTGAAARPGESRYLQWINASRGGVVRIITTDDILYFRSDHKYTLVVTQEGEALIKKTIRELCEELDPAMFSQVHRAAIVNMNAIHSVMRDERGNLTLRLKERPETLAVSEAYTHLFRQM